MVASNHPATTCGAQSGQLFPCCLVGARHRWSVDFFEGGAISRGGYSKWTDLRGWVVKENHPDQRTLRLKLDRVAFRVNKE